MTHDDRRAGIELLVRAEIGKKKMAYSQLIKTVQGNWRIGVKEIYLSV